MEIRPVLPHPTGICSTAPTAAGEVLDSGGVTLGLRIS